MTKCNLSILLCLQPLVKVKLSLWHTLARHPSASICEWWNMNQLWVQESCTLTCSSCVLKRSYSTLTTYERTLQAYIFSKYPMLIKGLCWVCRGNYTYTLIICSRIWSPIVSVRTPLKSRENTLSGVLCQLFWQSEKVLRRQNGQVKGMSIALTRQQFNWKLFQSWIGYIFSQGDVKQMLD